MDFYGHFNDARHLAANIQDWEDSSFGWKKAYVACAFAAIAYEEMPSFELKNSKRAKVIPCDRYQANFARWVTNQTQSSIQQLDTNIPFTIVTRNRVIVTIAKLTNVIFISLRGTTLAFKDFRADLDARKVKYSVGFGETVKLHRGFFDAVLECFDEVVEKVASVSDNHVPVYVTGHSLGGAMAAIFHSRLEDNEFSYFRNRRRWKIPSSISCYTFGMPRYGDLRAKSTLPQPYHVFNEFDAIPTLPPTFMGFSDSANERCLNAIPEQTTVLSKGNFALRSSRGIATVLGVSDHRMERYLERLNALKNNAP